MRRPHKRAAEHPDGHVTGAPPLIDGHALGGLVRAAYVVGRGPGEYPVRRHAGRVVLADLRRDSHGLADAVNCGPLSARARCAKWRRCPGHPLIRLSQAAEAWCPLVILACLTWAFTIGAVPVSGALGAACWSRRRPWSRCCRRGPAGPVGNCKRDPADRPAAGPVAGTGAGSARGCPHLSGPPD